MAAPFTVTTVRLLIDLTKKPRPVGRGSFNENLL